MSNNTYLMVYLRTYVLRLINDLSLKELSTIPQGFNNNIVWNVGHLIATDQRVWYMRSGLTPPVEPNFIARYQKGTKPTVFVEEAEVIQIKQLLFFSLEQFEADLNSHLFADYETWATPYGNTIHTIEEATNFLPFHEGLHIGCIKSLKQLVS
ncbi:DinB family protein [Olivibacter sp. SDN3]|uniref:DinB family protein n=1 Tax=Olivibacter sp. SDN3 TaxID=2764720 RepID=UPI0016518E6B|nr:DinB family protein [Olivibacter sp. SDN3]QNL49275.1 DinB family protein [Olivibacter sp. SDN3]